MSTGTSTFPENWDALVKKVREDLDMISVGKAITALRNTVVFSRADRRFSGGESHVAENLYKAVKNKHKGDYQKLLDALSK